MDREGLEEKYRRRQADAGIHDWLCALNHDDAALLGSTRVDPSTIVVTQEEREELDLQYLHQDPCVARSYVESVRELLTKADSQVVSAGVELLHHLLSQKEDAASAVGFLLNTLTHLFVYDPSLRGILLDLIDRPIFQGVVCAIHEDAIPVVTQATNGCRGNLLNLEADARGVLSYLRSSKTDYQELLPTDVEPKVVEGLEAVIEERFVGQCIETSALSCSLIAVATLLIHEPSAISIREGLSISQNANFFTVVGELFEGSIADKAMRFPTDFQIVEGLIYKAVGPLSFNVFTPQHYPSPLEYLSRGWLTQAETDEAIGALLIISAVMARHSRYQLLGEAMTSAKAVRSRIVSMILWRIRRRSCDSSSVRESDPTGLFNEVLGAHFGLSHKAEQDSVDCKDACCSSVSLPNSVANDAITDPKDFFNWFDRRVDDFLRTDCNREIRHRKMQSELALQSISASDRIDIPDYVQLRELCEELPEEMQLAHMWLVGGMSYSEIAKTYGWSRSRTHRKVTCALERLRQFVTT